MSAEEQHTEEVDQDEVNGGAHSASRNLIASQYEFRRDQDFKHLANEAADDRRATQRFYEIQRICAERMDNQVAENGILEKVEMVNFMCHPNLHFDFGPLLNFIVGENGSGKSAVLTAITLCLGGKASSTNRGGSLKSFIKENEERAMLSVSIKNQGESAYKHDIYGDTIVVERHFARKGNVSGFKIKSSTGSLISTKRQEVDEIVEYFALQVDNPLNILSQDNARQFLNASSKAQKYRFFVEGIHLQQLDNDYRLIQEYIERIESKIPELETLVKSTKAERERARRIKKEIADDQDLWVKRKLLESQAAWVQVRDQERVLEKRERALASIRAAIPEAEQMVEQRTRELELENENVRKAEQAVEDVDAEHEQMSTALETAQGKYKTLHTKLQKLHHDERDARTQATKEKGFLKDLETQIAAEEQRLADANGTAHASKLEELKAAEAEGKRISQELEQTKSQKPATRTRLDAARKAAAESLALVKAKHNEITAAQQRLRQHEENKGGKYDGYERAVPQLLQMIEQESSFEQKPIGPLGAHIQLLDPRWSDILEQNLGGALDTFVVVSKADQRTLQGLMNRVGVKRCPIAIVRNREKPIDVSGKDPDPRFDTILRLLKFDHNIIRDHLIITRVIEQIILIPDRREAEDVMFDGAAPRNVRACLAFHDGLRGQGLSLTNKSNNLATAPIEINVGRRARMQTDASSQVAQQKNFLQQLQGDLEGLTNEKRAHESEVTRLESELGKLTKTESGLKNSQRKAEVAIQRIQEEMDAFEGADSRLQDLRTRLDEKKTAHEHYGRQYGSLHVEKETLNEVVEAAMKEVQALKQEMTELEAKKTKVENKLDRCRKTREAAVAGKNHAIGELAVVKEQEGAAAAKLEAQVRTVQEFTQAATGFCPHRPEIPEGDTKDKILRELDAIKDRLEQNQARHGMTMDEAYAFVLKTKKEYEQAVESLSQNNAMINHMSMTLDRRLQRWRSFQRHISAAARTSFQYLLSERGFRGQLLIDHKNKTLDLIVEPEKAARRISGRTTKTLSGGEKSFSSICLLLAIWEAMGSPLRCLDEFDVFMDQVNRAISTDMLVSDGWRAFIREFDFGPKPRLGASPSRCPLLGCHLMRRSLTSGQISTARRSTSRQYIFITPNAIEGRSNLGLDVRVHRYMRKLIVGIGRMLISVSGCAIRVKELWP